MARNSDSESRRKHSKSSSRRERRSRSRDRSRRSRSRDRRPTRSRTRSRSTERRHKRSRRSPSTTSERRGSRRSRSRDGRRGTDREREYRHSRPRHRSSDRSRESSYDSRRSSKTKSRRERRRSRSVSSSDSSGGSSTEHHNKEKGSLLKERSSGDSLKTSADRKARVKEFLKAVEARDEEKWKKNVLESGATIVPDAEAILRIESADFVQESFTSSINKKVQDNSKLNSSEQSHEDAIFGSDIITSSVKQSKATTMPSLTPRTLQTGYDDSVALCLHEDDETKTARWIAKLKRMSQQLLTP